MRFEPTRGDPIGLAGRRLSRSAKVSQRSGAERKQRKTAPTARSHVAPTDGATHASRESLIWHASRGARTWPVQCARLVLREIGGRNTNGRFLACRLLLAGWAECAFGAFLPKLAPALSLPIFPSRDPGFLLSVLQLYTLTVSPRPPAPRAPCQMAKRGVEMFASRLRGFFLFRSCSHFSNLTMPL